MKLTKGILICLVICLRVSAQEKPAVTDHFTIEGKVKSAITVSTADIQSMPFMHVDSIVIKNHLMQKKYTMKDIDGVSLKPILSKATLLAEDPKQLSQFYFVFIASDNYKVVYSWNEIFNSPAGDQIFVIRKRDGLDLTDQPDAISVICKSDEATGRRFVKSLKKILVEKVNE